MEPFRYLSKPIPDTDISQAQALNGLFGVELFTEGQNIGRLISKLGHSGWDCWKRGDWNRGRLDDDLVRWDKWDRWFHRHADKRWAR